MTWVLSFFIYWVFHFYFTGCWITEYTSWIRLSRDSAIQDTKFSASRILNLSCHVGMNTSNTTNTYNTSHIIVSTLASIQWQKIMLLTNPLYFFPKSKKIMISIWFFTLFYAMIFPMFLFNFLPSQTIILVTFTFLFCVCHAKLYVSWQNP